MRDTKITVLDIQPILPPVGGGRIRLKGLYSGTGDFADITYIGSFDWRGPTARTVGISDTLTETDVPLSEEHFAAHDRLSALLGKPCIDASFPMIGNLSENLISKAREEAASSDIVVFSHPWLFGFVAPVLDPEKQLIVYDSQNCEGLLKDKLLDNGTDTADEICRCVVKSEYETCRAADLILACSEDDREAFVSLYGVEPEKIVIVPNGVFSTVITPPGNKTVKDKLKKKLKLPGNTACFLGSNYDPNAEAVAMILEAAAMVPDVQFVIMGGICERFDDARDSFPNVKFTGFLEEQEKLDYLRACDLAVNPMLSGSGTNIKMFDFMAAGLPVIVTDIGARGIDNTNGNVYELCGRDAQSLKNAVCRLLADGRRMGELSAEGRRQVEKRYSWESISLNLGKTLQNELRKKRSVKESVLMISTYPPEKCGIGKYAQQQAEYMRENGSRVDIMAIRGNGRFRRSFRSASDVLELKKYRDQYDRIIIQYHPSFFYADAAPEERMKIHQAFREVFEDNPGIETVCHEITFPEDKREAELVRAKWMAARTVIFHTEKERKAFCEFLKISTSDGKTRIVSPNKYYVKKRTISREEARQELGLPEKDIIFLCIGFIQAHKGFDKAADAFSKLDDAEGKALYIVGSIRYVSEETADYLKKVQSYSGRNNITVVNDYVTDELFDTWLSAADYVIIPYSEIWSSGVLGRAKLFGKNCIAKDVGGLREQLGENDIVFEEYDELPDIFSRL